MSALAEFLAAHGPREKRPTDAETKPRLTAMATENTHDDDDDHEKRLSEDHAPMAQPKSPEK